PKTTQFRSADTIALSMQSIAPDDVLEVEWIEETGEADDREWPAQPLQVGIALAVAPSAPRSAARPTRGRPKYSRAGSGRGVRRKALDFTRKRFSLGGGADTVSALARTAARAEGGRDSSHALWAGGLALPAAPRRRFARRLGCGCCTGRSGTDCRGGASVADRCRRVAHLRRDQRGWDQML